MAAVAPEGEPQPETLRGRLCLGSVGTAIAGARSRTPHRAGTPANPSSIMAAGTQLPERHVLDKQMYCMRDSWRPPPPLLLARSQGEEGGGGGGGCAEMHESSWYSP